MKKSENKTALRVQALLGAEFEVLEFDKGTRTAQDAADAVGCDVAQIAKSIIFKTKVTQRPVMVVASGTNRVDEKKVADVIGERIVRADADFVRDATGYAIGGVPPVGHAVRPVIVLDRDLCQFEEIWAAAGTPNAVFKLTPDQLSQLTDGSFENIAQG